MISQANLDFYLKNGLNVLMTGRRGTGKTSSVIDAFERNGLKWLYFSVPTMDPWVDLVGIPHEMTDENGYTYLDLIRPKAFAYDEVEAIFLDEYNRGSDKVRNATMELIQFRSINGKKFKNLKVIWACINPDNDIEQYDVQPLDPGQKDRFFVQIEVPYDMDKNYFINKYGSYIGNNAYSWWHSLPESARNQISPRRVEYALQMYNMGGNLRDVLPYDAANVTYLQSVLENGSIEARLEKIMKDKNSKEATSIMKNDTEYTEAIKWIIQDKERCLFFLPLVNSEKYRALITEHIKNQDTLKNILSTYDVCDEHCQIIKSCYYDINMKYDIIPAIPPAKPDKFSTNLNLVKDFNVNKGYTEGFVEHVNKFGAVRNHTLAEFKDMYKYIIENIGMVGKGKVGSATIVILFFGKVCNFLRDRKKILDNFPEIFGLLNACLKIEQIDLLTDPKYKMQARVCSEIGVEDLVWIPNK